MSSILDTHRKGDVHIPTELETIMLEDAQQLIKESYDHLEGANQLQKLLAKNKKGKNLLMLTDLDKKIKLS